MADVAVLIPVLDRPSAAQLVVDSLRQASSLELEIVFLASPDDDAEIAACDATGERVIVVSWAPGHGDYAKKINAGFRMTDAPWVFLGADDLDFKRGWDVAAVACAGTKFAVVGTNDLGNAEVKKGKHSTHSLVRRSYVAEHGLTWDGRPAIVYSDAYEHQWVDTEMVSVAIDRDVFVFCGASVVEHLHPLWGKGVMDDTYRKALERGREDGELFRRRRTELSGRFVTTLAKEDTDE